MTVRARDRWCGWLGGLMVLLSTPGWTALARAGDREGPTLWGSVQLVAFTPSGEFQPINGPSGGLAGQAVLTDPRYPVGLRLEFGGAFISDEAILDSATIATYTGTGYPEPPSSMTARSSVVWLTGGLQAGAMGAANGLYAFATAGFVGVNNSAQLSFPGVFHTSDAEHVPPSDLGFGATGGVGGRLVFGRKRKHGIDAEVEYVLGPEVDYLGTTSSAPAYETTHLLTARGPVRGWTVQLGYMLRLMGSGPAERGSR